MGLQSFSRSRGLNPPQAPTGGLHALTLLGLHPPQAPTGGFAPHYIAAVAFLQAELEARPSARETLLLLQLNDTLLLLQGEALLPAAAADLVRIYSYRGAATGPAAGYILIEVLRRVRRRGIFLSRRN